MQNFDENIDINTLKFLYERYKDFILPFFIILASFLIFARVVLPSIFDFLDAREKQKTELETLSNMENKIILLKDLDEAGLDSQLRIVSKALPIGKDFEAVLNAISNASDKSSVSIARFKFSVGSLSEEEEGVREVGQFPIYNLEMDLTVNGSSVAMNDFIGRLNKTLPISEISEISAGKDTSDIKISFYYKPLVRSKPDDIRPLPPVSDKGLSLISEMSNNFSIPSSSIFDSSLATSSAGVNPNPFE